MLDSLRSSNTESHEYNMQRIHLWCRIDALGSLRSPKASIPSTSGFQYMFHVWMGAANPNVEHVLNTANHCVFRMSCMCSSKPFGLLRPTCITFLHTMMFLDPSETTLEVRPFTAWALSGGPS